MKKWLRENRGFLIFLLLFGLFRTAVADWNPIPSGSMRPNLLEGDVVLVNRLAYALKLPLTDIILQRTGEPQRGDIATFSSPADGKRLIKRIVALPGDQVEMRGKQLIINGERADYDLLDEHTEALGNGDSASAVQLTEHWQGRTRTVQWLPGYSRGADYGPVTLPPDQYLMLGDNRDNSADSRYIGFVSRNLIIGRAERILVSADILQNWHLRTERFGKNLEE